MGLGQCMGGLGVCPSLSRMEVRDSTGGLSLKIGYLLAGKAISASWISGGLSLKAG